MRIIDGDKLLARYKERCAGCKETKNYCEHCCDIADVISDIEDAPTIDAVEVVRCRDCALAEEHIQKCYDGTEETCFICLYRKTYCFDGDGYCNHGFRKAGKEKPDDKK